MNNTQLRSLLEIKLASTTTTPIIYENTGQTAPTTMYLETMLRPVSDDRLTINSTGNFIKRVGVFWVYVIDPTNTGTANASNEAENIASAFTATTVSGEHGYVHIDVPNIKFFGRLDKGYTVAVSIPYWFYRTP